MPPPTPKEIRDNLALARKSDKHNRDAYRENIKFLCGDQWDSIEAQKRRNKRLMLTTDMLNAPVDQVVNSIRQNKPGPQVSPVSDADQDAAEVMNGLLRHIDYENNAWTAIDTAMENATGGNFGCWGVDLEYRNDRSFARKLKVREIPNANETVFFDPAAIKKDRLDADFAFEVMVLTPDKYKRYFADSKYVRENKGSGSFVRSITDFFATFGDKSLMNWTTEDGIQVVKYWRIESEPDRLRYYSNGVSYWDSERDKIPADITEDKTVNPRDIEHRKLRCYVSNGAEILKSYDWPIDVIPLFPVYGRERWSEGKRLLFSMIQLAKQAQQAFNFAFTGACEVLSLSTKAPWIGLLGQFKSKMAQWQKANVEPQAYLEYDEVVLGNNQTHVVPPQRNVQEPPIQAFLAFCNLCVNAIQRATSVFDPSLGKQKSDQSGRAIQELQEQSNEGNFHWADNLTITLTSYYKSNMRLVQAEYDSAQVAMILKPDMKSTEEVYINQEFTAGIKPDGSEIRKNHRIADGEFSLVVAIGPKFDDQREADIAKIDTLVQHLPPELFAQCADIIVKLQDLGPMGKELADRITPSQYRNPQDPAAAAQQLGQMAQQNKSLLALVQKLQFQLSSKQPQLDNDLKRTMIQVVGGIREAEIKGGIDKSQQDLDAMEHFTGLAHDAATSHLDRQNTLDLADKQIQAAQVAAQQPEPDGDEGNP